MSINTFLDYNDDSLPAESTTKLKVKSLKTSILESDSFETSIVMTQAVEIDNDSGVRQLTIQYNDTNGAVDFNQANGFSGGEYKIMDSRPFDNPNNFHQNGRLDFYTQFNSNPVANPTSAVYFEQGLNIGPYTGNTTGYVTTCLRNFTHNIIPSIGSNNMVGPPTSFLNYCIINNVLTGSFTVKSATAVSISSSGVPTYFEYGDTVLFNYLAANFHRTFMFTLPGGTPMIADVAQGVTSGVVRIYFETSAFTPFPAGTLIFPADVNGVNRYSY